MSDGIMITIGDDGEATLYDDTYDITIHCESKEEQDEVRKALKNIPHWIPVERALPELRHDVLLTVFFHEKWNVTEGYRQDGEFMFWNHGRLDSVLDEENRVRAWMPKPEPFKGVTDGRY